MACRRRDQGTNRRRWWSPICRTAAAVVLALAALAAPAGASTLTKAAGTIVYNAGGGETNRLTVSRLGTDYVFAESGGVTIEEDCENGASAASVRCGAAGVTAIQIFLQDQMPGQIDVLTIDNSVAAAGQVSIVAEGGTGDDTLIGGNGPESLCGGPGDDTIDGGGGDDRLDFPCTDPQEDQTPGADTLHGGAGNDQLNGGRAGLPLDGDKLFGDGGTDTAYYDQRSAPLTITLDDVANDGETGEGDNVHSDVENLIGGSGRDTLVGSGAANALDGRDGDDIIVGASGDDVVTGGNGNDTLSGSNGNDTVIGADGEDFLDGGADDDTLSGGGAGDTLLGGGGRDIMAGGPGSDTLSGGDGDDVLDGAEVGLVGADGDDKLSGDAGADVLRGGPGDDRLDGGTEADQLNGEDGHDTLTYESRASPVTVTFDGLANDGEAGEHDNVASDIEVVVGGTLWDTLIGDGRANTFEGGRDEDFLDGKAGVDTLDAGVGSDLVWARDGTHDKVDCGGGGDLAVYDRGDEVRNCRWRDETGRRNPVPGQSARVSGSTFAFRLPVGHHDFLLHGSLKFPMGSTIRAGRRSVHVSTAIASKDARQNVTVSGDGFKVTQRTRRSTPVYRFADHPQGCSRARGAPRASADAQAPRIVMQIDKRRRSRGRRARQRQAVVLTNYSAGGALGTKWITEERCSGTLTRVISGVVQVTDFTRHRTVMVRAGHSYLAPSKR
jgi:Ca2+-binding RTX toxin-like protein